MGPFAAQRSCRKARRRRRHGPGVPERSLRRPEAKHSACPGRYYEARKPAPGRAAPLAQSAEHGHGKAGVVGSIPTGGSGVISRDRQDPLRSSAMVLGRRYRGSDAGPIPTQLACGDFVGPMVLPVREALVVSGACTTARKRACRLAKNVPACWPKVPRSSDHKGQIPVARQGSENSAWGVNHKEERHWIRPRRWIRGTLAVARCAGWR
jgi:hypothetical protein